MDRKEIELFLSQKPGYLKEGKRRLRSILLSKGFNVSEEDCAEAIRHMRYKGITKPVASVNKDLKVLVYDIETSYNIIKAFRTGYNQTIGPSDIIKERAIICVSYKWLGEDQVYNINWDSKQCDKTLLEQFIPIMNEADLLVAHNGDKFDIRFIKGRAFKHNLPMMVNYAQFDTCKVARKKFDINSKSLDYISRYLGITESKMKVGMTLWDRVILEKDRKALDKMIEYCNKDVTVLEKVYQRMIDWEYPKVHAGVILSADRITSPYSGSKNIELFKTTSTTRGTVKRIMKCNDTDRTFELSDAQYRKFVEE